MACAALLIEPMVLDRLFLLGCPLEYVLLDGTVGDGWYTFGFAIPVFIYTLRWSMLYAGRLWWVSYYEEN